MRLFPKRTEKKTYDRSNQKPVIKASICNGERWRDSRISTRENLKKSC